MILRCDKAKLLKAIGAVLPAVAGVSRGSIAGAVRVAVDASGACSLNVVSYGMKSRTTVDVDAVASGVAVVTAAELNIAISAMANGSVIQLSTDSGGARGERLIVSSGRSTFNLAAFEASEFPDVSMVRDGRAFSLPAALLGRALEVCAPFVSKDDKRPVLQSVQVLIADGGMTAVATDGFVVSRMTAEIDAPDLKLYLPDDAIRVLRHLLDDAENVEFCDNGRDLWIGVGDTAIVIRPSEDPFPGVLKLFDKNPGRGVRLSRDEIKAALNAVVVLDAGNCVTMARDDGALRLSMRSRQGEEASTTVDLAVDCEAAPTISFDAQKLRKVLAIFNADFVLMHVTDTMAPAMFTSPRDPSAAAIIMPMNPDGVA